MRPSRSVWGCSDFSQSCHYPSRTMNERQNNRTATLVHRAFRRPAAERRWLEVVSRTFRLKDHQGNKIDFGVLHLVAALQAPGFKTIASCEGHIHRGKAVPWVDLALDEQTRVRLRSLLARFYHQRPVQSNRRLTLLPSGHRGRFRLIPAGSRAILRDSERNPHLFRCRWEAQDFAEFLQKEYFATTKTA